MSLSCTVVPTMIVCLFLGVASTFLTRLPPNVSPCASPRRCIERMIVVLSVVLCFDMFDMRLLGGG